MPRTRRSITPSHSSCRTLAAIPLSPITRARRSKSERKISTPVRSRGAKTSSERKACAACSSTRSDSTRRGISARFSAGTSSAARCPIPAPTTAGPAIHNERGTPQTSTQWIAAAVPSDASSAPRVEARQVALAYASDRSTTNGTISPDVLFSASWTASSTRRKSSGENTRFTFIEGFLPDVRHETRAGRK